MAGGIWIRGGLFLFYIDLRCWYVDAIMMRLRFFNFFLMSLSTSQIGVFCYGDFPSRTIWP